MAPGKKELAPFEKTGLHFLGQFYGAFDKDRSLLAPLYRDGSMLTWEGEQLLGPGQIMDKLVNRLQFKTAQHELVTFEPEDQIDSVIIHPITDEGALLINAVGRILADGESIPLNYTETLLLIPDGQGSLYIKSQIWRLLYL